MECGFDTHKNALTKNLVILFVFFCAFESIYSFFKPIVFFYLTYNNNLLDRYSTLWSLIILLWALTYFAVPFRISWWTLAAVVAAHIDARSTVQAWVRGCNGKQINLTSTGLCRLLQWCKQICQYRYNVSTYIVYKQICLSHECWKYQAINRGDR